jgi:hypothetical protein
MHISYQRILRIYRKESHFFTEYRSGGASENLKTCRISYLGLDLSIFVKYFEICLVTQSL